MLQRPIFGALGLIVALLGGLTAYSAQAQNAPSAAVVDVTKDTWQHEVLHNKLPVFVIFYDVACKPCDAQARIVEDLAKEYAGKVKFVRVDVVAQHEIRDSFNITRVPTLFVMKLDEKTVYTNDGFMDRPALKEFIKEGLAQKH